MTKSTDKQFNDLLDSYGKSATLVVNGVVWPVLIAQTEDLSDILPNASDCNDDVLIGLLRAKLNVVITGPPVVQN